jgi:hypothetical protein
LDDQGQSDNLLSQFEEELEEPLPFFTASSSEYSYEIDKESQWTGLDTNVRVFTGPWMPMIARSPVLSKIKRMMTTTILPDRTASSMGIAAEVGGAATMEVSILRYNQERGLDVVANSNTNAYNDEKNEAVEETLRCHSYGR